MIRLCDTEEKLKTKQNKKHKPLSNLTADHSELIFAKMAFSVLAAWQTGFSQNSFALE